MHLFYTPNINSDTFILNEEESRHCIRVLRLQRGAVVQLVDGEGGFYTAVIEDPHPKKTALKILDVQQQFSRRNHFLHIAVAPTKNIERLEWFLEKATEIGIDEVSLLICEHSERKDLKTARLNKVITAAMKQSQKAYHPRLNEAVKFRDFIERASASHKYIAHCMESEKTTLKEGFTLYSDYLVLIGPEGDFSPAEIGCALEAGYAAISFGKSRLRTETAALEACFEINFLNR